MADIMIKYRPIYSEIVPTPQYENVNADCLHKLLKLNFHWAFVPATLSMVLPFIFTSFFDKTFIQNYVNTEH